MTTKTSKTSKKQHNGGARARMPVIGDPQKLIAAIAKGEKAVGVFLGRRVGCKALAGEAGIVVRSGEQFLLEGKVKCGATGCKNYGVVRIPPVDYGLVRYQCKKHGDAE